MFFLSKPKPVVCSLFIAIALSACGGKSTNESNNNNNDEKNHPRSSWDNVSGSSSFSPSGNITDTSPSFSWGAISGATDYQFGHDNAGSMAEWREYTVSATKMGCTDSGSTCSYTPNDYTLSVGDEKAWWVRAKLPKGWSNWSDANVFKVISSDSGDGGTSGGIPVAGKLLPPDNGKIYFGAFTDSGALEDQVTASKINDFDSLAQKPIAWSYFSNNWYNSNGDPEIKYPRQNIRTVVDQGKTPFIRLIPWVTGRQINNVGTTARKSRGDDLTSVCHQSNNTRTMLIKKSSLATHKGHGDLEGPCRNSFSMQKIIDGDWDDELKQWARDAKNDRDASGKLIPLLVTFSIEMNGYWFPWSGIYHGGPTKNQYGDPKLADGPERYRDAYRHIIDLFNAEGADNITWFFIPDTMDPNEDWVKFLQEDWNAQRNYYPGDDYIDWIGMNLYGAAALDYDWTKFSEDLAIKSEAIKDITSNKPVALMEFGVIEGHPRGNKSAWLNDAFNTIVSGDYLSFKAISYWHEDWSNGTGGMKIDSSSESLSIFRRLISNSKFTSTLKFSQ